MLLLLITANLRPSALQRPGDTQSKVGTVLLPATSPTRTAGQPVIPESCMLHTFIEYRTELSSTIKSQFVPLKIRRLPESSTARSIVFRRSRWPVHGYKAECSGGFDTGSGVPNPTVRDVSSFAAASPLDRKHPVTRYHVPGSPQLAFADNMDVLVQGRRRTNVAGNHQQFVTRRISFGQLGL